MITQLLNRAGRPPPDEEQNIFGSLLREYRKRRSLTQRQLIEELADLNYNLGDATISTWECGTRLPDDTKVIPRLGKCLGLTEDEEEALFSAWMLDKYLAHLQDYMEEKRS